jgi:hypothetical protein
MPSAIMPNTTKIGAPPNHRDKKQSMRLPQDNLLASLRVNQNPRLQALQISS